MAAFSLTHYKVSVKNTTPHLCVCVCVCVHVLLLHCTIKFSYCFNKKRYVNVAKRDKFTKLPGLFAWWQQEVLFKTCRPKKGPHSNKCKRIMLHQNTSNNKPPQQAFFFLFFFFFCFFGAPAKEPEYPNVFLYPYTPQVPIPIPVLTKVGCIGMYVHITKPTHPHTTATQNIMYVHYTSIDRF